jgi:hypothetical protein
VLYNVLAQPGWNLCPWPLCIWAEGLFFWDLISVASCMLVGRSLLCLFPYL